MHGLASSLKLRDFTLVGHDAGGMAAWPYLRTYRDAARVVIMDTVIPGIDPWAEVLANPYVWHFAMHAIPGLPETLVSGRERPYFDYFFDVLTPDPTLIGEPAREAAVKAYGTESALAAGFSWDRTMTADAKQNAADTGEVDTPLLYIRGEREMGGIARYADSFRKAGIRNVQTALIPGAGHFTAEERPAEVWRAIAGFAALP